MRAAMALFECAPKSITSASKAEISLSARPRSVPDPNILRTRKPREAALKGIFAYACGQKAPSALCRIAFSDKDADLINLGQPLDYPGSAEQFEVIIGLVIGGLAFRRNGNGSGHEQLRPCRA